MLASVAASLCYNFFFLPPVYTFTITDPTNVAAFFFFMLIALLVSNVGSRVGNQPGEDHRIALRPARLAQRHRRLPLRDHARRHPGDGRRRRALPAQADR